MATNKIAKFRDITAMQYFLNGAIEGGVEVKLGIRGLIGKTLVFTSPASHTVTFTASTNPKIPDPGVLQFGDIKAQIEAVMTTCTVASHNGTVVVIEKVPASGVVLSSAGTGNILLGFDQLGVTGKFYTPPGVAAGAQQWTWAYSVNENSHVVFTYE